MKSPSADAGEIEGEVVDPIRLGEHPSGHVSARQRRRREKKGGPVKQRLEFGDQNSGDLDLSHRDGLDPDRPGSPRGPGGKVPETLAPSLPKTAMAEDQKKSEGERRDGGENCERGVHIDHSIRLP